MTNWATPGSATNTALTRTNMLALLVAVLSFIGIFTLPYHLPVHPAFSVSYITGFNNHAAVLLFVLSAALFAYACPSLRLRQAVTDAQLPIWTLLLALLLTAAAILIVLHQHGTVGGSESQYQLERLNHLYAGQTMYRQFEYVYGPLLLYPAQWIHLAFHWNPQPSCRLAWALQWFAGVAMLWFTVARNAIPTRHRTLVFFLLFILSLSSTSSEGVNQTCFRSVCAPFLCVAVFLLWQRSCSPYWKSLAAVIAIALGFAVSPEQGSALSFGLCTYAVWLTWNNRKLFPWSAVLLLWAGTGSVLLVISHTGELDSARSMAGGGYSFPLLPSPIQLFTLGIYLCAALVLYQAVADRETNTATLPLGLCGLPLLLPAFGRCDYGHLATATPLYLLGLLWLSRRPRILWAAYTLLVVYFFFVPMAIRHMKPGAPHPYPTATAPQSMDLKTDMAIDPAQDYFAPLAVPLREDGQLPWHADSGYYFGVWDVTSPAAMQAKADEIERRRAPLLLLPETGQPLRFPLWASDMTPDSLYTLEHSSHIPRQIRPQLDGANIVATIQRLYEPTAQQQEGWRVWKLRQQR